MCQDNKSTRLLKSLTLLLFLLVFGCGKDSSGQLYLLLINFQDVSSLDLLRGIPLTQGMFFDENSDCGYINPDLYKMEMFLSKQCFKNYELGNPYLPQLFVMRTNSGHSVLFFRIVSDGKCPTNSIEFKLTCPYIFEDNGEHLITTYWQHGAKTRFESLYRVTMDGKEFLITKEESTDMHIAWIVLSN